VSYELMTRPEYVARCKQRALAETEPADMLASMASDLRKRPETADLVAFCVMAGAGQTHDTAAMRHFIEGFN
jgi:hypothetical protein